MQAYSRTSDKPQLKKFRKATRYTHHRSEGLRGHRGMPDERSSKVAKMLYAVSGPASHGYVDQD